jgi:hypothetical protein
VLGTGVVVHEGFANCVCAGTCGWVVLVMVCCHVLVVGRWVVCWAGGWGGGGRTFVGVTVRVGRGVTGT